MGGAKQLRLEGRGDPELADGIMDRWTGEDRVILAVQAAGPVGILAAVAAFETERPTRCDAIAKAGRHLECELLLPFLVIRTRSDNFVLAFPLGLQSQVSRPGQPPVEKAFLHDRLQF